MIFIREKLEKDDGKITYVKHVRDPALGGRECVDICVNTEGMTVKDLQKKLRNEMGKAAYRRLEAKIDWEAVNSKQVKAVHPIP